MNETNDTLEAPVAEPSGPVESDAPADPVLAFENVSFTPPGTDTRLIENLSFSLAPGKRILVTGGFQSGKSTVLRLAFGHGRATEGKVTLLGEDLFPLDYGPLHALRQQVGYMPETGALLSNITLYDNLVLPLRYHTQMSEEEIREKADRMLALLQESELPTVLPPLSDRCTCRKVAMARALMRDPKLLILDDPTEDFDAKLSCRLWECICTLSEQLNIAVLATANEPDQGRACMHEILDLDEKRPDARAEEEGDP